MKNLVEQNNEKKPLTSKDMVHTQVWTYLEATADTRTSQPSREHIYIYLGLSTHQCGTGCGILILDICIQVCTQIGAARYPLEAYTKIVPADEGYNVYMYSNASRNDHPGVLRIGGLVDKGILHHIFIVTFLGIL